MLKVSLICSVYFMGCVYGFSQPQLAWKFDHNATNNYINDTKSNGENRGILLPGTSIINGNSTGKVVYFNGNNSGLIFHNITSDCFAMPRVCKNGLSLSFWINLLQWRNSSVILYSQTMKIVFTANDTLAISVWNGSHEWELSYKARGHVWNCYVITWNTTALRFYVSGGLKGEISNSTAKASTAESQNREATRRLEIGTAEDYKNERTRTRMYVDNLQIWNDTLKSNEIYKACALGKGSRRVDYKPRYFSQAFTSLEYTNKALVGYTFRTITVTDLDECIKHCMDNKNDCKSFNYETTNGLSLCELNSVEATNSKLFIQQRENFQFYDVYWTD